MLSKNNMHFTITVRSEPDNDGRQVFDVEWIDGYGIKHGQVFNAVLQSQIRLFEGRGTVQVDRLDKPT